MSVSRKLTERLLDSLTNEAEKHFGPFIYPDRSVNANGRFTLLVTETFRKVETVQFAMSELIQDTSIENWISIKTKTT